jgi:hypothetical protein
LPNARAVDYQVTTSHVGNGVISLEGVNNVAAGVDFIMGAIANSGYVIDYYLIDGEADYSDNGQSSGYYTFVNVQANHVYVAYFTDMSSHSVSVSIIDPEATTYYATGTSFSIPIELSASVTGSSLINITWGVTFGGLWAIKDQLYSGPTYWSSSVSGTHAFVFYATAYNDAGDSDTDSVTFTVYVSEPEPTPTPTPSPTPTPTATPTPSPTPTPEPLEYNYQFLGPYYEDGSDASGSVTITMLSTLGNSSQLTLSSPINTNVTSSSKLVQVSYNASSAWNITRIVSFLPTETDVVLRLYIADPDVALAYYNLNIVDFASMTNPYLQVSVINEVDGESVVFVLERHNLDSASTVPFVLSQFQTYTLTVICDQGSYTQLFTAGNEFTVNIPILAGVFPVSTGGLPKFDAARLNSTAIGLSFIDSSETTDWLYFIITHVSGSTTIIDYTYNSTGDTQTVLWNYAETDKSYLVSATASINGVEYTWVIPLGQASSDNPWLGLLDWLGHDTPTLPRVHTGWPFGMSSLQIAQLAAASIIMLFLCIGSFRSAGACCILAWIIGGVMLYLGWWGGGTTYASIPLFTLAGFLSIFIALDEGKQQVREV